MTEIEVRGGATPEELAALLAALSPGAREMGDGREDGYARWRRGRWQALAGRWQAPDGPDGRFLARR